MKRLKDLNQGVPGGWYFKDPDTHMKIESGCWEYLKSFCRDHRRANRLPIPDNFDQIIESQICERVPDSFTKDLPAQCYKKDSLTAITTQQKIEVLKQIWKESGSLIVDEPIALERAEICRFCKENLAKECLSCNGVMEWLRMSFGIPKMKIDDYLHTCSVDRVYNKAQVHLDTAVFVKKVSQDRIDRYPEKCWKRKLLEAYYARITP